MSELQEKIGLLPQAELQKIILSKPKEKSAEYKKIVIEKKKGYFQAARYTEKQVFHVNLKEEELGAFLAEELEQRFSQLNAWDEKKEYMILISKKGKITLKGMAGNPQVVRKEQNGGHNRKKNYILEEGQTIPALVDMGVFTKEGKIVRTMYDKFRQINRFLEIVEDGVKEYGKDEIHIIDFGCGKSYLTFILYYYFTEIKQLKTQIIGWI